MAAAPKPAPVYGVTAAAEGFALQCNGRNMKTPVGADYLLPTQALAAAAINEWQAQGDKIDPASMPLMQLAATALDIVEKNRGATIDRLMAFVDSELTCHRAAEPDALVQRQHKIWQPLLNWCLQKFGARFENGAGIMPVRQSAETARALRGFLERQNSFYLSGLAHTADMAGSLVIALALAENHVTPAQAFEAAELDALFQMEKWGEDPVVTKRHETIGSELALCHEWFGLLPKDGKNH